MSPCPPGCLEHAEALMLVVFLNLFCSFLEHINFLIFTARKRSLGQGNIFSSLCQEFCSRGRYASYWNAILLHIYSSQKETNLEGST